MINLKTPLKYTVINGYMFLYNLLAYPFSRIARHRMSAAYDSLTYPFYGNNYVDISSLLVDEGLQVILSPVKANKHNVSAFELLSIAAIVKDKKCNQVFEIGTYDGRTTRTMALNLLNEKGKVYTLNLSPGTEEVNLQTGKVDVLLASKVVSGERFINSPQAKNIEQLWGDSATFDFIEHYGSMDLVFIDGAHSEDYAASDTTQAMKLIKETGGYIMWHDAPLYGVVKFLKKWVPKQAGPVIFIKDTSLAIAFVQKGKITLWINS